MPYIQNDTLRDSLQGLASNFRHIFIPGEGFYRMYHHKWKGGGDKIELEETTEQSVTAPPFGLRGLLGKGSNPQIRRRGSDIFIRVLEKLRLFTWVIFP